MSKDINDLYYENLAVAHEKQCKLVDLVGQEEAYTVDFKKKKLLFGSGSTFDFVVLGSESFDESSWLWAWANENLALSESVMSKSMEFKEYGTKNCIETFTQPMLQLGDGWSAQEISLISLGISDYSAYYRYPHEHGAFYLLLEQNDKFTNDESVDMAKINSCFTDCWSLYDDGNHIDILKFYLKHKQIPYQISSGLLQATLGDQKLKCRFGASGHALECKVEL